MLFVDWVGDDGRMMSECFRSRGAASLWVEREIGGLTESGKRVSAWLEDASLNLRPGEELSTDCQYGRLYLGKP